MSGRPRERGFAAVESLLAVPVLLFVGLGAVQWALVHQARLALNLALHEAARAGSVLHAQPDAIRDGLARGLMPWLHGATDAAGHAQGLVRSRAHVAEAEARGWLRLERQSPTGASFADWAEPARDAFGEPIDGVREIPNDDLVHRATRAVPAGGIAGTRRGEPIGAASGQTLADANLLRLRMTYGVPLSVPVAGRLTAWALRAWHGCEVAAARTWGVLRLDAPPRGAPPDPDACAMLAPADGGPARLPVSGSATVRMQTPSRDAGAAVPLAALPQAGRGAPPRGPVGGTSPGAPEGSVRDPGAPDGMPGTPPAGDPPATPPSATVPTRPGGSTRPSGGLLGGATVSDPAFCRTADG